jgi:ribosome-associated toxin RatA of RatAB toxin-antitoxin module
MIPTRKGRVMSSQANSSIDYDSAEMSEEREANEASRPIEERPKLTPEESAHQAAELYEKVSFFIKRFNTLMVLICSLGGLGIYFKLSPSDTVPFLVGSALVWVNTLLLAHGLRGVISGDKRLAGVLLLKFAFLLGGIYVLISSFPESALASLLGCSTWVLALMAIGPSQPSSVAITLLVLSALHPSIGEARPTEAEMLEGEVYVHTRTIKGSDMPKLMAEGVIKAAPAELWKVISDCANFSKTMPSIESSRVLGYVKGKKRCELVVDLPWPISDLRSVVDVTLTENKDGSFVRSWTLVEGDYHKNQGEWKLLPRPDGYTLLKYQVHVEPKVSIPDFIKRAAQKSKLPDMFENLRDVMQKRGKLLP